MVATGKTVPTVSAVCSAGLDVCCCFCLFAFQIVEGSACFGRDNVINKRNAVYDSVLDGV